jgi:hypothetical protein
MNMKTAAYGEHGSVPEVSAANASVLYNSYIIVLMYLDLYL